MCPHRLRLAIIPGQPVLFGYIPEGDSRGVVCLVPERERATEVAALRQSLEEALDASGVYL